jgi:hypothetical protein
LRILSGKNESYTVFGILKGDRPSMAFHAVAKGSVQRLNRLLTGDKSRTKKIFFVTATTATRGLK